MSPQPSPTLPVMSATQFSAHLDSLDVAERRRVAEALLRRVVVKAKPNLAGDQRSALLDMLFAVLSVAILDQSFLEDDMDEETEAKAFGLRQYQTERMNGAAGALTAETMQALLGDIASVAFTAAALAGHPQARTKATSERTLH